MSLHKENRTRLRALRVVQGLAIASLCAGPGIASANIIANYGAQYRPGDGDTGTTQIGGTGGEQQNQGEYGQTPQGESFTTDAFTDTGTVITDTGSSDNGGNDNPPQTESIVDNAAAVPVPEPGALALLVAGLAGLLYAQLRRRSADRAVTTDER